MIKFIKNLLGFGAKETVQEILTPAPYKVEPPVVQTLVVEAKPVAPATNKVAAKPSKPNKKKAKAPVAKPQQAKPANKGKPASKPKAKTKK